MDLIIDGATMAARFDRIVAVVMDAVAEHGIAAVALRLQS